METPAPLRAVDALSQGVGSVRCVLAELGLETVSVATRILW